MIKILHRGVLLAAFALNLPLIIQAFPSLRLINIPLLVLLWIAFHPLGHARWSWMIYWLMVVGIVIPLIPFGWTVVAGIAIVLFIQYSQKTVVEHNHIATVTVVMVCSTVLWELLISLGLQIHSATTQALPIVSNDWNAFIVIITEALATTIAFMTIIFFESRIRRSPIQDVLRCYYERLHGPSFRSSR